MQILRREGHIQQGYEAACLRNQTFNLEDVKMLKWIQLPSASHPAVDVLREAIELEKADPYPASLIDSPFYKLIADTYVTLHEAVVPSLADTVSEDTDRTQTNRETMRVDTVMNSQLVPSAFSPTLPLDSWDILKRERTDVASPSPAKRMVILRSADILISRAGAVTKHDREPEPSPPTEPLQDSSNRKSVERDDHAIIAVASDSRPEIMHNGDENREEEGKNNHSEEAPDEADILTKKATVADDPPDAMEVDHHHIQQDNNNKEGVSHTDHDAVAGEYKVKPASPGRPSTSSSSSLSTVSSSLLSLTHSAAPSHGRDVTSPHPTPTPLNTGGGERQVDDNDGDHHMDDESMPT